MNKKLEITERILDFNDDLDFPTCISSNAKSFINCCIKKKPHKRWNVRKLLTHPFVADVHEKLIVKVQSNVNISLDGFYKNGFPVLKMDQGLENEDLKSGISSTGKIRYRSDPNHLGMIEKLYGRDVNRSPSRSNVHEKPQISRSPMRNSNTHKTPVVMELKMGLSPFLPKPF